MDKKCFNCGKEGEKYFDYIICKDCLSKLKLLSEEKIKKHLVANKSKNSRSFEEEVKFRLGFIEKDYIKKKIKLLHILDRIQKVK